MSAAGLEHYLDVEEKGPHRPNYGTLKQLVPYLMRHSGTLGLGFLMMILGTVATLLEPRILGWTVDLAIVPRNERFLRLFGIAYFGAVLIRVLGMILQAYFFELLGQKIAQDLRCEVYERLLRMPIAIYDKNPVGRLMTRATNDVSALGEMFTAGFVSMGGNAVLVLGILTWLLVLDLSLGLLAVAVFPALAFVAIYFSKRLKVTYREARSRLSALNAFMAENILGMKVVQLFNREGIHRARFGRINDWYTDAQIGTIKVFALFQPSITVFSGIAIGLIMAYGGHHAYRGNLPIGLLVAYFSYVLALFQPLREMADKWNVFLSGMASAERIFSILSWPLEPGTRVPAPGPRAETRGEIVFEHVWFAYSGENWVLRDFSLEIRAHERLGIVGHTGGGKTTLISLLLRFYEPQKGRILLDGIDIREYALKELRARFGVIQQDGFLFSGKLSGSIQAELERLLGKAEYSKGALEFPAELAERASNISAGQKQLLAFARALAAKPEVWVLDEATANMDSETERLLHEALATATANRTAILVAHRLSTIRSADRIAVLNKGVLCELGSHRDLLRNNGLYARLYRYQAAREAQESQKV